MKVRHTFLTTLLMAVLAQLVFAQTEAELRFVEGLNNICLMAKSMLPVVVIALFAIAAIAYAAGQVFGAEMRGRATGWAINMVVGAIIGLIIYMLAEPILGLFIAPEQIPTDFCK